MERIARICFGFLLVSVISAGYSSAQDIVPLGRLFDYWDSATDVVVEGNYAYVATGISGLQVVDISDPQNPRVVSVFDDFNDAMTRVFLVGDFIYASTYNTVSIFDISRAPNLRKVRDVWVWSFFGTIDIDGTMMLAAGEEPWELSNRITLFDISVPSNPVLVDTLHLESQTIYDIDIQGNYAFIATDNILTIDLSDAENMSVVGNYQGGAAQLIANGDYVYISGGGFFGILSIVDPLNLQLDHRVRQIYGENDMKISGDLLFLSGARHLTCFDLTTPANPREISSVRVMTDYGRFFPALPLVITANETDGILVIDYSDTEHPDSIGFFNSVGEVKDVRLIDGIAYICSNKAGFQIVDSSNPLNPEVISSLPLQGYSKHAEIQNNIAYSASGRNGIYLVDITNPSEASVISNYDPDEAWISNLSVRDDYLFSISGSFRVLNIANPDSIYQTGQCGGGYNSDELECARSDTHIYFVTHYSNDNFGIVDISDPYSPQIVFSDSLVLGNDANLSDIVLKDTIAYISGLFDGLLVMDISDPSSPEQLAQYEYDFTGLDRMVIEGDYLIGASRYYGVSIYDISNPVTPRFLRRFEDCYNLNAISVEGNIAAVAQSTSLRFYNLNGQRSVPIFEGTIPFDNDLISAYPNPFNSSATIEVNLPSNAPMRLALFDLSGRALQSWNFPVNVVNSQGRVILDGEGLPSGSLYLQADSRGNVQTLPILHLK